MPGRMRDPSPSGHGRQIGCGVEASGEVADTEERRASAPQDVPTGPHQDWTIVELRRLAAEVGIVGRSRMRKDALVRALRSSSGRAS